MNKENNYYLVPMWNYKDHKMKDHLALIEAQNKYQAMLIAMGSHNWTPIDENDCSTLVSDEDKWNIDMNYESYQECKTPEHIFTYMNRNAKIESSKVEEDSHMDIYDYMYWGDYNSQIQALVEKSLPENWNFEGRTDNYILKNYLKYTFKNYKMKIK